MSKRRLPAIWTALLCLLMANASAWAQGSGHPAPKGEVTASISDQATPGAPATPEVQELMSGGVSATVTVLANESPFPAGGSAFAQIKLTNTSKARRIDAELVFEAETAVIQGASGSKVKLREEGTARIATVEKIVRGKPSTVIVEVKLREGPANKLKITLRGPRSAGDTATLRWAAASCASGFYSEIVKVRNGSGSGIAAALKAARSRDRARPGRWLFPPRYKSARTKRKCVRRAKRWSSARERYVSRCTGYRTETPAIASMGDPTKTERKIFNFASRYVSARAVDRELARTRDSGWAANRVSQNLRGFLKQDASPAICTGALGFLDYFDQRMAGFTRRADKFDEMAGKSWHRAVIRTGEAQEAIKSETGGHPGWGAAPLDMKSASDQTTLKSQIEVLARIASDPELDQRVAEAENSFEALRAMSAYFKTAEAKALGPATRGAMYRALSAIEAADYIGAVARHYSDLRHSIMGSMATIRRAHLANCTCGG